MSTGSTPPEGAFEADPELARALDTVRGLGAGRFDVLGPLGKDREGEYAFLGRALGHGRLVVLKRRLVGSSTGSNSAVLEVVERLDDSVPPPAGSCAFCHTPFSSWEPSCPDCGADVAGSAPASASDAELQRLREAVQMAAPGYDVLGDMRRARGGGIVFFAREPASGHLVALRLEEGAEAGGGVGRTQLTVAATRMMRPHLTYGTVGGGRTGSSRTPSAGPSRPWRPINSPSVAMRSGTLSAGGAGQAEAGLKVCPQCGEAFEGDLRFCPRDGAALRSREATGDLVGQVIAERYHIVRLLGEGGMGRVYLAEHVRMGRTCAVKVMNPKLLNDPDSVSRFSREAANASRITHPNVAAIYDFGEMDDIVYIAMEYVDGPSLAGVLAKDRRLDQRRVVGIGTQVADALAAAHDFGIVHRDLKPDNVMLTRSRTGEDLVKVVDFGIAKATQGGRQNVTRTGFVIGTPAYMSPEQILGDVLDGRSDIYSLGCILYEMVTGARVFAGSSGEVSIHQRLTEPAPRARVVQQDISSGLDEVVAKALARSPDQRFQSAGELRDALAGTLAEAEEPVGSATTMLRHRSSRAEGPRLGWMVGAVVGLAAIGVAGWLWLRPHGVADDTQPLRIPATPTAPVATAPGSGPSAPAPVTPEPVETGGTPTPGTTPAPAPAPVPNPGTVAFEQPLPPDARVTVDGKEARVPNDGTISLSPGRHGIAVRVPGFRPFTQNVRIVSGQTESIALRLDPDQRTPAPSGTPRQPEPAPSPEPVPVAGPGTIAIQGNLPEGAAIDVDGRPLAIGVRSVNTTAGRHWVRVSVPGYRSDSSLVEVVAGQETGWTAPTLVALVKTAPPPAPASEPAERAPSGYGYPAPKLPPSGPAPAPAPAPAADAESESQIRGEIVSLLADYQKAINARDIARLKTLFPSMPGESERRWRDLFGKDVNDLKAVVTLTSIVPASSARIATFKVVLTFKPTGGKAQKYQLTDVGTLRREAAGWRFLDLVESGT
jgi:tRNA A-37 threonylcarbamoyl transferase component Bud32